MEQLIIRHCAPTLAGIKTANLFTCKSSENMTDLKSCREKLERKGIAIAVIYQNKNSSLIYVYRKDRLILDWKNERSIHLLKKLGYETGNVERCISELGKRIEKNGEFPHEIGLFLGYPIEDVEGFIKNKGQNFKCMGFWKVYCNECETVKTFAKFKKCMDVYTRMYECGRSIDKLTVAI